METVAVYSDPDAGAPFVRDADEAVHLPGAAPGETYLNIERIVAAARTRGADAVHPGYGFLAENAAFARACADAGLTFVGPSPETIDAMGSKLEAKAIMAVAGVPVLPSVEVGGDGSALDAAANDVGFPLLVKASFGGGGRGMRIVRRADELAPAVASAEREAAAAFGDGTVFLERYVEDPRHIEVQIFGDAHGTVIHLFERECSIQRRYQKIVEEAPSPAVDDRLRAELGSSAVTAAKALGYVGAGTVEFVLDPEGRFSFLEVNTRLQVEHPVTELTTGLDLVRLQLLVAAGEPLPDEALSASINGHAIEARLYAEDVDAGFLPVSGTLDRLRFAGDGDGVRVDNGYEDGSLVSTHYDALLAKVIAWAPTREEAARRLERSLRGAQVHGLKTNRHLLVGVVGHAEFLAGRTDTGFLVRHDPASLGKPSLDARPLSALAAALAGQAGRRASARVQTTIPIGWRNVGDGWQRVTFADEHGEVAVAYRFTRAGFESEGLPSVHLVSASADVVTLSVDGVLGTFDVHRVEARAYVDGPRGSFSFTELDRFPPREAAAVPGSLLAPMPGTVVRLPADPGQRVRAGDALVVIEAMKMEHAVAAPHDGVLAEVRVAVGEQVDTGQVLAIVEAGGD
jgi:acetyl/propionyl-CoA carboxylase alpha subunit